MTDQVVELLRDGMLSGRWRDTLPGRDQLAVELGVSHTTMETAMRRLTKDGLLVSQGPGKRRRIVLTECNVVPRDYRIHFLSYESMSPGLPQVLDLLAQLRKAGFAVDAAPKSLLDLEMDAKRVARMVQQNPADDGSLLPDPAKYLNGLANSPYLPMPISGTSRISPSPDALSEETCPC